MSEYYDVIIAGGGPAGATCALLLARAGLNVCILEKATHPRFHIGESILPQNMPLVRELGLEEALGKIPHVPKFGAEFIIGNDPSSMRFSFADGLVPGSPTFNVERSVFDKMLIDEARASGATVFEDRPVTAILRLNHEDVEVATPSGNVSGRLLLDCSGQSTLVGRHLKTRHLFTDPLLRKVGYFQHFDDVRRSDGQRQGDPVIVLCQEGWFWLIPLNERRTSVGFVTRPSFVGHLNIAPEKLLRWAIERCPVVRQRMKDASGSAENHVLADFSYRCRPLAGNGYFLVGDAGCFLDPIFSTGVTLAMVAAREAVRQTIDILQRKRNVAHARQDYCRYVEGSTAIFWGLIRASYRHSFRELFMNGKGPMRVHNAVISVLAGHVFPRPRWSLRWRLWFFHWCVWLQRFVALSPRRPVCSLMEQPPVPLERQLVEAK